MRRSAAVATLFLVSVALSAATAAVASSSDDKVQLGVYVESFCPYCQSFQTTSLKTMLATPGFWDIVNMTLVPFGNAVIQNGQIQCQHGPQECIGNTIECCAIKYNPDPRKYWPFVLCMEAHGDNMLQYPEQCAHDAGLDWKEIDTCYNGPIGHQCDLQAGAETPADHQYVPWVVVDGTQLQNTNALMYQVCQDYKGANKPAACNNLPPPSSDDDDDNVPGFSKALH